jgi:hypothetical protein
VHVYGETGKQIAHFENKAYEYLSVVD